MNQTVENTAAPVSARTANKGLSIASWVVQIGLAAIFVMAGTAKLRGVPMMVGLFETIGVGQWFRYLTGGLEVLGAVLLLVPRLAAFGGALLVPVMLGAVATHLFIVGGSPAMPIALLLGALFVAWVRRDDLARAVARVRG